MSNEIIQSKLQSVTIQKLVHNKDFIAKAEDMLGKRTPQFLSSVLSLVNTDSKLNECDPIKVYNCCLMAAALDLPVNKNLGQAWVVAYGKEPQLQIGWKGFVQLAQRSGKFKTINATEVKDGEVVKQDRLTGEIQFEWIDDDAERDGKKTVGYVAYFKLLDGFEKTLYWSIEKVEQHAKKFSQTYKKGFGCWADYFDDMAKKTVIKQLLSKWAPLSVEMERAIQLDQSDAGGKYPDNGPSVTIIDAELGMSEEDVKEGAVK